MRCRPLSPWRGDLCEPALPALFSVGQRLKACHQRRGRHEDKRTLGFLGGRWLTQAISTMLQA